MLIGIVSDTHDNMANFEKAIAVFKEKKIDYLIHCGDWCSPFMPDLVKDFRVVSVFGNNDGDLFTFLQKSKNWQNIQFEKECATIEEGGKKIAVYHGVSRAILDSLLACQEYDLVCSGHSHRPAIKEHGKTLHVNPGSTSGLLGKRPSVAVYDAETAKAEIVEL
jgi:uncharacterized protein